MLRKTLSPCLLALALVGCDTTDDADDNGTDGPTDSTDAPTGDTEVDTDDTELSPITWPDTPEDYVFEAGTYLSAYTIPTGSIGGAPDFAFTMDDPCCRDWGADSKNGEGDDNALAVLNGSLRAFFNMQAELTANVEGGGFVALLDHRGMPSGNGTFDMAFFLGAFEGATTYVEASAGTGTFTVDPASFKPGGTGQPQVVFRNVEKTGDTITATDGDFTVALSLGSVALDVSVSDVTMAGTVSRSGAGVGITDGALSGYILLEDFFAAFNTLVDTQCSCAGVTGDLYTESGGVWTGQCMSNADVEAACTQPAEALCPIVIGNTIAQGGICAAFPLFVPGATDIDTDGDDAYDALSVGLRFEGQPASVVGVTP